MMKNIIFIIFKVTKCILEHYFNLLMNLCHNPWQSRYFPVVLFVFASHSCHFIFPCILYNQISKISKLSTSNTKKKESCKKYRLEKVDILIMLSLFSSSSFSLQEPLLNVNSVLHSLNKLHLNMMHYPVNYYRIQRRESEGTNTDQKEVDGIGDYSCSQIFTLTKF